MIYSKHCLEHAASLVEYLGRYTHKIAITDARILRVDDERVTLHYNDYADHDRHRTLTPEEPEFARRFVMHIVSNGLIRMRHYGFLANRCRKRKLACVRAALANANEDGSGNGPRPRSARRWNRGPESGTLSPGKSFEARGNAQNKRKRRIISLDFSGNRHRCGQLENTIPYR